MNLEVRSFRNMIEWYGDELLYIHEKSRKPSTINTRVAKRLVKKGFIERRKAHGYVLTERAIRVLKELKELDQLQKIASDVSGRGRSEC